MRDEPRVNVPGCPGGVIGQGHRGTACHEHVRDDASAGEPLAQGGEGPFELGPAKKDITRIGHAASRSRADRYTPCFAEGSWCPYQRIGPLNLQFGGEPGPAQHAELGPRWRGSVMAGGQVLGQRGQQRIPSFVPGRLRLFLQERMSLVKLFGPTGREFWLRPGAAAGSGAGRAAG